MADVGHELGLGARRFFGRVARFTRGALGLAKFTDVHEGHQDAGGLAVRAGYRGLGDGQIAPRAVAVQRGCVIAHAAATLQKFRVARVVSLGFAAAELIPGMVASHLVAPAAGELFPGLVDRHIAPMGVQDGQRQRHHFEQQFGEGQLRLELVLCLDAIGDVHRAAGVADDATLHQQRRNGRLELPGGRFCAQHQMGDARAGRAVGGEQACRRGR